MVGSVSDTYGDFHPLFDSESGKNSNFEGSKQEEIDALRLRDHFDFVLVRSLILLVGWNHNYSVF